jgi:hypothetical protein
LAGVVRRGGEDCEGEDDDEGLSDENGMIPPLILRKQRLKKIHLRTVYDLKKQRIGDSFLGEGKWRFPMVSAGCYRRISEYGERAARREPAML